MEEYVVAAFVMSCVVAVNLCECHVFCPVLLLLLLSLLVAAARGCC
jgi:hypothetical protein